MDFDSLLRQAEEAQPIEPRELYEQLPAKAEGYGYLRDVQAQILTQWHDRRGDRDIVVKVNTGGGKTIDGLVILQSYLNDGKGPALYVAPTRYLVRQVLAEADHLGLAVTTNVESSEYIAGESIGVVTAAKLFNGRSVFSDSRGPGTRVPIGCVVIDDAHSAITAMRSQLSMNISRGNPTFGTLLALFESDLEAQSPDALLDIQDERGSGFVRVPFWAVRTNVTALRAALRAHVQDNELDFSYDAIKDVLQHCRIVFTRHGVTVTPPCPPIGRVSNFIHAKHRVFLSATLADDSVLVSDFGADHALVAKPIQPLSAGDIGERLILAPEEINPSITADDVRAEVVKLAQTHNTLVIVPSNPAMDKWPANAERADADNLEQVVERMRNGHVGLVVVANKYDGIDLPQKACRVLVIDGLPQAFTGDDRLEALMQSSVAGVDDRQVQRLEQGMGRGVRSNEDHCVVFLIGRRLAQLTTDPRTLDRFSPATRAQLRASRTVAKSMDNTPLSTIMQTVQQALERDTGWVKFAKRALRSLPPEPARVSDATVAEREAFDTAVRNDTAGAAGVLTTAAEHCTDERRAGRLLEQAAAYIDFTDPVRAQQLLATAKVKNIYVLRPHAGIVYTPLTYAGAQANTIASRLTARYGTPASMRVAVESMLDSLDFNPSTSEEFEEAMFELGNFLGFNSQRPERELGSGPDNLWVLESGMFWVIEAKSGATSEFIGKRDAGQLSQSMLWFGKKYAPSDVATPVMVHHSTKLYNDATPPVGMRVANERVMGELVASVRAFSEGLAASGWSDVAVVDRLLEGHKLRPGQLVARLRPTTGGTS